MNAVSLIQTLTFTNATANKLETAQKVLEKLQDMKKIKGMPFLVIRRAIRMQEGIVKNLEA